MKEPGEAIKIIKRLIASIELVYKSNPLTDKEPHSETDALILAISALKKQEQDRWIPVSVRLPEEETDVLICNADGDIAISRGSMSTESTGTWIWYTSGWRFGKVTAWRPLPEPYMEEES